MTPAGSAENSFVPCNVKLLNTPGVHFLARRFGSPGLRQAAYDAKFLAGKWDTGPGEVSPVLVETVLRYAGGGRVALMGCGTGGLAAVLDRSGCASILGIDLSPVAVERAKGLALAHARFEVADICSWECTGRYDAIVLEESLYYLSRREQERFLAAHRASLTRTGVFVVTVSDAARYRAMLNMIRSRYQVLEDRENWNARQRLIVFR